MEIDERLLAYKPISITLNFDWDNTTYDERVQMRHDYIEEQKKKDPNYVGYDFPEHFSSTHGKSIGNMKFYTSFNTLVNTLGQVLKICKNTNKLIVSFGYKNKRGYCSHSIHTTQEGSKIFKVHRLVAGTFIPIPDNLKTLQNELVVNHKDDVKCNNLRSNLEWCTNQENQIKAVETGAKRSMKLKATYIVPDRYYGTEIYFNNYKEAMAAGFSRSGFQKSLSGKIKVAQGCVWERVTDIPTKTGVPEHLKEIFLDTPYLTITTEPLLVTILKPGKHYGEQFTLLGECEVVAHELNYSTIVNGMRFRGGYSKNCHYKRITREECKSYQRGMNGDQKKFLLDSR